MLLDVVQTTPIKITVAGYVELNQLRILVVNRDEL